MYDQIIFPRTISSSIEMPESGYNINLMEAYVEPWWEIAVSMLSIKLKGETMTGLISMQLKVTDLLKTSWQFFLKISRDVWTHY